MALNARKVKNNSGPKAPLIDDGAYPARLQGVVDLGLQEQVFKNESKPPKREIWTTYELSDEFMPDEDGEPDESKPRWFSEIIPLNNLDSDLAKSTKRYYALDPNEEEEGEWTELIGKPVIVTIITKGEYNNIGGTAVMRAKEASKLPELVNPSRVFLFDEPDVEVFLTLPNFIQERIKNGLEFEGSKLEELLKKHKAGDKSEDKTEKKTEREKREVVEEDSIPFDDKKEDDGDDW